MYVHIVLVEKYGISGICLQRLHVCARVCRCAGVYVSPQVCVRRKRFPTVAPDNCSCAPQAGKGSTPADSFRQWLGEAQQSGGAAGGPSILVPGRLCASTSPSTAQQGGTPGATPLVPQVVWVMCTGPGQRAVAETDDDDSLMGWLHKQYKV